VFYIQTPGQILQLVLGQFRDIWSDAFRPYRPFQRKFHRFGLLFLPDENFRRHIISDGVLRHDYKRPVVDLEKRQSHGEGADWHGKNDGQKKRQHNMQKKYQPSSAGKINKLLEGQRPENLALNLYKLWDLKTHTL